MKRYILPLALPVAAIALFLGLVLRQDPSGASPTANRYSPAPAGFERSPVKTHDETEKEYVDLPSAYGNHPGTTPAGTEYSRGTTGSLPGRDLSRKPGQDLPAKPDDLQAGKRELVSLLHIALGDAGTSESDMDQIRRLITVLENEK